MFFILNRYWYSPLTCLEDIHSYLECKGPYISQKHLFYWFCFKFNMHYTFLSRWIYHTMEKPNNFRKNYIFTSKIQQPSPKFIHIIVIKCTLSTILSEVYIFRWRLTVSIRTNSFEENCHPIYRHHGDECAVLTRGSLFFKILYL